jgi:hypothetical protein
LGYTLIKSARKALDGSSPRPGDTVHARRFVALPHGATQPIAECAWTKYTERAPVEVPACVLTLLAPHDLRNEASSRGWRHALDDTRHQGWIARKSGPAAITLFCPGDAPQVALFK